MNHVNQGSHPQNGQGLQIEKISAKALVLKRLREFVNYDIFFLFLVLKKESQVNPFCLLWRATQSENEAGLDGGCPT
jgi:hypothetical protein